MSFIGNSPADKILGPDDITPGIFVETSSAQTFTAPQRGSVLVDNDLSFDLNVSNNFKCTTINVGTITFTNLIAGQSGYIVFDNLAGYAISKDSNVNAGLAFLSSISQSGKYLISYFCDGTNTILTASGALV